MTTPILDLNSDAAFAHVRPSDREVVGYIAITDAGEFVPFDLLHRQVAPAGELPEAEELLERIGLTLLAETYVAQHDGQPVRVGIKELTRDEVTVGPVAGDITPGSADLDLTERWSYPLPTGELRPPAD